MCFKIDYGFNQIVQFPVRKNDFFKNQELH